MVLYYESTGTAGGAPTEKGTEMKEIKDTQITAQNVNLKIDPVVKESAESVLANMGLNMSAYIGMCLRQLAQDREIPFTQKADPGFWAAEYRAYKAKRIIDSGIMWTMSLLYTNLICSINDLEADLLRLALNPEHSASPAFKLAQKIAAALSFDESIGVVHVRLSKLAADIAEITEAGIIDEAELKPLVLFKEGIEALDAKIVDACHKIALDTPDLAELLCSTFDSPSDEDCEITRENCSIHLATLFSYALDAYEANPESIAIRYTGQVGGSLITTLLETASTEREALSKAKIEIH